MKSFYLFVVCFFVFLNLGFSQDNSPLTKQLKFDNYKYFNHKRAVQKTYGWVAVGTGIVFYGIGMAQASSNYYIDNDPAKGYPPSKKTPYFIAGTLAELVSIPFFISANNNKKKATLALKNESALLFNINNYVNYPSIRFSVQL